MAHRVWDDDELKAYPKKDNATYWVCEEYPKAWGHGPHDNPLPKKAVPRERPPMRDPTPSTTPRPTTSTSPNTTTPATSSTEVQRRSRSQLRNAYQSKHKQTPIYIFERYFVDSSVAFENGHANLAQPNIQQPKTPTTCSLN